MYVYEAVITLFGVTNIHCYFFLFLNSGGKINLLFLKHESRTLIGKLICISFFPGVDRNKKIVRTEIKQAK